MRRVARVLWALHVILQEVHCPCNTLSHQSVPVSLFKFMVCLSAHCCIKLLCTLGAVRQYFAICSAARALRKFALMSVMR